MEAGHVLRLVGGLFYVALGFAVWWAGPRRAANRAFALYVIPTGAFGPSVAILAEVRPDAIDPVFDVASVPVSIAAAAGLVLLARSFPSPIGRESSRILSLSAAVGVLVAALAATWWGLYSVANDLPRSAWPAGYSFALLDGFTWGSLALFALRADRERAEAASLGLVTVAIAVPASVGMGGWLMPWPSTFAGELALNVLRASLALGIGAFLWLRVAARGGPRWAIAVAWTFLGTALLSLASDLSYFAGVEEGVRHGAFVAGVLRVLAAAILAIALVRGQVRGFDGKLRFGLSRGTLAAAFVAAFFVASEGAQIVFGQGNEWVGLLAAGALVFTMAPLQRAAERLAERVVPVASADGATPGASGARESSYRKAVRLAVRDRRITREEEGHLHELARDLGIDGARAHAILAEVEAEPREVR